jgi:hypothetical protein
MNKKQRTKWLEMLEKRVTLEKLRDLKEMGLAITVSSA